MTTKSDQLGNIGTTQQPVNYNSLTKDLEDDSGDTDIDVLSMLAEVDKQTKKIKRKSKTLKRKAVSYVDKTFQKDITVETEHSIGNDLTVILKSKLITDTNGESFMEATDGRSDLDKHDYLGGRSCFWLNHIEVIQRTSITIELDTPKNVREKKRIINIDQLCLAFPEPEPELQTNTETVLFTGDLENTLICRNTNGVIDVNSDDCSITNDWHRLVKKPHVKRKIIKHLQDNLVELGISEDELDFSDLPKVILQ